MDTKKFDKALLDITNFCEYLSIKPTKARELSTLR